MTSPRRCMLAGVSPLIPLSSINKYQYQLKDLILLLFFLKLLTMLILELREILHYQPHIFQGTYFESAHIYLLTIMYCFEHISHDILLNFLFQNLYKLFLHAHDLHQ